MNVSEHALKIAVFIDFDNIEIGVKTTLNREFEVGAVLDAIKERGEVITKVAYGDWKKTGDYSKMLTQHAVRMVQRNMTPGGDKNGADINLALDALEMAFTHAHINAFVIVGGDSDFISLVEKLKQYDRKVFVVGGRQFTSVVMQKNCTEFIAYENVIRQPSRRQSQGQAPLRTDRSGAQAQPSAPSSTPHVSKAFPLVTRALQILTDREVTPQLGLLKSTLLQLDSAFSERDYGASSFRDFADKLAEAGLVTLRSAGRSVLVELHDGAAPPPPEAADSVPAEPDTQPAAPVHEAPAAEPQAEAMPGQPLEPQHDGPQTSIVDGIRLFQKVLMTPGAIPRWPMYIRNAKQAMRAVDPTFDERKHGNLVEILRAVQRDGLIRLDRDRQGVLRVFQGPQLRMAPPPQRDPVDLQPEAEATAHDEAPAVEPGFGQAGESAGTTTPDAPAAGAPDATAAFEPQATSEDGPGDAEPASDKPKRRRKTGTAAPKAKSTAARKPRVRTTPTTSRKKKEETETE
jgi:uncharacterized LabA/DUF88 family protein